MTLYQQLLALREIAESAEDEDTKKEARDLYEKMGGDEALEKAKEDEPDDDEDDEEEPPPSSSKRSDDKGKDDKSEKARTSKSAKRSKEERGARGDSALPLALRVANLEASKARGEVRALVNKHADRFTPTTKEWALEQPIEVVRSYIKKAPKLDLKAPAAAPATRGAGQGETRTGAPDISTDDATKLDRILGIRAPVGKLGFSDYDPTEGVVKFRTAAPEDIHRIQREGRSAQKER